MSRFSRCQKPSLWRCPSPRPAQRLLAHLTAVYCKQGNGTGDAARRAAAESPRNEPGSTRWNMLRRSLLNVGSHVNRQQHTGIHSVTAGLRNGGAEQRRDVSSSTTTSTAVGTSNKQRTMDDLGGPSFMTTLNWLFIKGYFQKAQQMQVRGWSYCFFPSELYCTMSCS